MQYFLLALIVLWVAYKVKSVNTAAPKDANTLSKQQAREILGVEEEASKEEVEAAFKDLIKKIHPDAGGSEYLTELTIKARKVLIDE